MRLLPQYSPSGTNSMLNFFTGALDVAYMGSSPLLLGHSYRLPLRILAVANAHHGSLAVVGRDREDTDSALKLGTVLGSDGHVLAHHFAAADPKRRVFHVNLSPEECLHALRMGMIDCAALWEPYVSIASEAGASVWFDDQDLDFRMFSFLVATEKVVGEKTAALEAVIEAHLAAVDAIESDLGRFSSRLRMIFGPDLTAASYERILRERYEWPRHDFLAEGAIAAEVETALERVRETHVALGTVEETGPGIGLLAPHDEVPDLLPEEQHLNLGYSNSIMCSTFHVGDLGGLFDAKGLLMEVGRRRVEERIARVGAERQDDLRLCYELIDRDPELVIQKLGRMNEQLFRKQLTRLSGQEHKSFGAVLESLRELDAIPRDILSWSDSIRSIRNVATHENETLTREEAQNAFNIFLNVVEWCDRHQLESIVAESRCPRCRAAVDEDWIACPECGASLNAQCESCGDGLQPNWKLCPRCGTAIA
jgi:hypothetical protein